MTTNSPAAKPQEGELLPIYVASRASLPERGVMWRRFRDEGVRITSSWIDEDGEGATGDFGELWMRIANEIAASVALVLYAEAEDFPLKGALIEAGIALGMGKPVIVCLPDAGVLPRSYRPIGSWITHPLVTRCDNANAAVKLASRTRADLPRATAVDSQTIIQTIQGVQNASDLDDGGFFEAGFIAAKTAIIDAVLELPRATGETTVEAAKLKEEHGGTMESNTGI